MRDDGVHPIQYHRNAQRSQTLTEGTQFRCTAHIAGLVEQGPNDYCN